MRKLIETYSRRETYLLIFQSIGYVLPLALLTGCIVAFFLSALEQVTLLQQRNALLLYLLPAAGALIYILYRRYGEHSARGNKLIIEEIHTPGGGLPAYMAPLVFLSTLITHLFGGSAGREGTAVQMSGSIAAFLSDRFHVKPALRRILLISGISAGFGAVFGTPFTGAIFAIEVLAAGTKRDDAFLPALLAAILADLICIALGAHHTVYNILPATPGLFSCNPITAVQVIVAGLAFGLASRIFIAAEHSVKYLGNRFIQKEWLRPVMGGLILILLCQFPGMRDYTGLGITTSGHGVSIVTAFLPSGAGYLSWFWKILFTAITLGSGFKGGEVTPLFFIGATLGNCLATVIGAPVDLFAGLGFIAVFAGATRTPLACTIMGVELFGKEHLVYFALASFTAYYFSGKKSIYA